MVCGKRGYKLVRENCEFFRKNPVFCLINQGHLGTMIIVWRYLFRGLCVAIAKMRESATRDLVVP